MNDRHSPELMDLLGAVCNGDVTADQMAELERRMLGDASARRAYLRYIDLHAELRFDRGVLMQTLSAHPSSRRHVRAREAVRVDRRRRVQWLAAAASIVITLGVLMALMVRESAQRWNRLNPPEPVAVVTALNHARWADGESAAAARPGAPLKPCILRLASGEARIEFNSGARVTLVGPAELALNHAKRAFLQHGVLTAQVPPQARGFTVGAPGVVIVDLGTEFGVHVGSDGAARVQVFKGIVEVALEDAPDKPIRLTDSAGVIADYSAGTLKRATLDERLFGRAPAPAYAGPVPLGNLFDDPPHTPIAQAIASDTYMALAGDFALGIDRVSYGGPMVQTLCPGVEMDLSPLTWSEQAWGSVANDAWSTMAGTQSETPGGIRTIGESMSGDAPRAEQGVGMHTNALITFDLGKLRDAGLARGPIRFVCDRAGLNDDVVGASARVYVAAVVVGPRGVVAAHVNGRRVETQRRGGVFHMTSDVPPALRADGRYARFDVAIPADATYLVLIAAGSPINQAHAVFSGARLETGFEN